MTRVLLTFETLHKLLAAEKSVKELDRNSILVRPTPTPPSISEAVCSMSLEILDPELSERILLHLEQVGLVPRAVHKI